MPTAAAELPGPTPANTGDDAVVASSLPLAPRVRLDFLDGLRGVAAFYVTVHHTVQLYMTEKADPAPRWFGLYPYLIMGEYAVVMFIVLSGFCLMLPVARTEDGQLRGAFSGYMRRRMKRILPVYYVSLVISLLLIAFVPGMARGDGEFWGLAFPAFDWKVIASHVVMLHALRPDTINAINPPMWSLGVEWLNYFLFPLLLLPIWRRLGNLMLVVTATVVCFLPYAVWVLLNNPRGLLHNPAAVLHPADAGINAAWYTLQWAHPWYFAMFAIGMAGAAMQYSPRRSRLDQRILQLALHPAVTAAVIVFFTFQLIPEHLALRMPKLARALWSIHLKRVPMDFIMGGLMILIILHCSHQTKPGSIGRRILQSGPALWVGAISYSLYLFHVPVLVILHRVLELMHLSAFGRLAWLTIVGIPLTLVVGAISYRFLERPMLSNPGSKSSVQ